MDGFKVIDYKEDHISIAYSDFSLKDDSYNLYEV